ARRPRTRVWVTLGLALFKWAALPSRGIVAAAPGATCQDWTTVPIANIPGGYLTGVTALNSEDAWAVSSFEDSRKPRTLHWDGSDWKQVPNPAPYGTLTSVDGVSPNDVWAVGTGNKLITDPWDGTTWSR